MSSAKIIRYANSNTPVLLGDHVRAKHFFRRYLCRVVYIPGQSPLHKDFEHDGLMWLGLMSEKGRLIMPLIDPDSFEIKSTVEFIRRDANPVQAFDPATSLEPDQDDDDDGGCERFEK